MELSRFQHFLIQIFREVFPTKEELVVLECVWKSDKFVLVERTQNSSDIASRDFDLEEQTLLKASSSVQYLSIESFLGGKVTQQFFTVSDGFLTHFNLSHK